MENREFECSFFQNEVLLELQYKGKYFKFEILGDI